MPRLTARQDAFGQGLFDYLQNRSGFEIIERDDGYIEPGAPAAYLAEYPSWPRIQKEALRLAKGRILDIGCGAGRVALHLQRKGLDVTGIDISPLAVKVCRLRGFKKARVMSVTEVGRRLGVFDTIIMFGNNFGLFASFRRARRLLRRFHAMTSPEAVILAETNDIYRTDNPVHLAYHRRNRRRGRMSGQIRLRVRYRNLATPWYDYLMVSRPEMRSILDGTGWRADRFIESAGSTYVAVIVKEETAPSIRR